MSKLQTRLPGHTILIEGAPFGPDGARLLNLRSQRGGQGRGRCECGAMSEDLPSVTARLQWHREHKNEIRGSVPKPSDGMRRAGTVPCTRCDDVLRAHEENGTIGLYCGSCGLFLDVVVPPWAVRR